MPDELPWADEQEFIDALEGEFGVEEQEDALDFAEEHGLLGPDDDEGDFEDDDYYDDEDDYYEDDDEGEGDFEDDPMMQGLAAELQHLEKRIGRRLTGAEERSLLESVPAQDWHDNAVPDFSSHADKLKDRSQVSKDERIALMAEAADDAKAEQEPDPEPEPDWLREESGGQDDDDAE